MYEYESDDDDVPDVAEQTESEGEHPAAFGDDDSDIESVAESETPEFREIEKFRDSR